MNEKMRFINHLKDHAKHIAQYVSNNSGAWSIKGFINENYDIYTISSDTKIISKILEIQLFPILKDFAEKIGYKIILAEKQNWYPDLSFEKKDDESIKFAVDIKTTYRLDNRKGYCNGFTLGSHGEYFKNRNSRKNIQFPYSEYKAHITLGILYTRALHKDIDETMLFNIKSMEKIVPVIRDLEFFVEEKWKIASDRSGSGNTANIGSINCIDNIFNGDGTFTKYGEDIFDGYWMNYGVLHVPDPKEPGTFKKLTKLSEYMNFIGRDM